VLSCSWRRRGSSGTAAMSVNPTFFIVRAWWLTAAALAVMGAVAYWNSFESGHVKASGTWGRDDMPSARVQVEKRQGVARELWKNHRLASERPLYQAGVAAQEMLSEVAPWACHLINVALHAVAGLLLFGVVWRSMDSATMPEKVRLRALPLAGAMAVLWLVHPVHTAAVTPAVPGAELWAGLVMLAALYLAIRGHASARRGWWYMGAVLACLLGAGIHAQTAAMPLVILLHDTIFNGTRYREAWREHWQLYAGLAGSWLVTGCLYVLARGEGTNTGGTIPLWRWVLAQPEILVHYMRLSLFPRPLVFQYYWPVAESGWAQWRAVLGAGVVMGVALWAAVRRRWYGFVGLWFIVLALAGSVAPLRPEQLCQEQRLYLPVAAVIVLLVVGINWVAEYGMQCWDNTLGWKLIPPAGVVALCLVYTGLTIERNADYRSEAQLAWDSAQKQPGRWEAWWQAGELTRQAGELAKATSCYARVVALQPANVAARYQLGAVQARLGCYAAALSNLYAGAELAEDRTPFELQIAETYLASGASNAARQAYLRVLERDASNVIARVQVSCLPETAPAALAGRTSPSAPAGPRSRSMFPRRPAPWRRARRRE